MRPHRPEVGVQELVMLHLNNHESEEPEESGGKRFEYQQFQEAGNYVTMDSRMRQCSQFRSRLKGLQEGLGTRFA